MRFLLLFLLPLIGNAQCETTRNGRAYLGLPSFFSLYFSGQCVEGNMGDTTICVKYPPQSVGMVAGFSYSSPSGQPAFVTAINQYNEYCELIEASPMIYPSADTITVCYTIQAALIDNFCPYAILSPGLSVEFCGVSAYHKQNFLTVNWTTCSNAGTKHFSILESADAVNWKEFAQIPPHYTNSSDLLTYRFEGLYSQHGVRYICIREYDYNGNSHDSEIIPITIPAPVKPMGGVYDILGRTVQDSNYRMYVQPSR